MTRIPIALQLYSVREDCDRDLPGTLAAIAQMGYDGVEFAGYYGRRAKELRKMCDDLGLKVAGTHIGLEALLGDQIASTVEFNQVLGNKYLIVPWLRPERTRSKYAWLETAMIFDGIASRLKPLGLFIGYHNHSTEFAPLDGELSWHTFFGNTTPEVVMQMDTGNCAQGKGDVVAMIKPYFGRARTVHLKEYSETNDTALIGEGEIPWAEIFACCEKAGSNTDWYIVEQESHAFPPLECVDKCLQNLKKMEVV